VADEFPLLSSLSERPDGGALYIPMCDAMHSVPPPPRFMFGDFPNDLMVRYFSEAYCGPVGIYCLTNMNLFGQTLLFRDDVVFQCHEIQVHHGNLPLYINEYRASAGHIRIRPESGTCVLLLGPAYPIYGHWLVDFLPKLFVLQMAGFKLLSLKYLIPADTPKFGLDLLDLFGINEGNRVVYDHRVEVIRPEQLVVPTMLRTNSRTSRLFGQAAKFMASQIWARHRRPAVRPDMTRIFISRARANKPFRRLGNRDRIEQIAAEAGLSIVHPEQLPLLEQFAIFGNASHIVGEYGSALHGSMFSRPGTMVCALRGSGSPIAGFLQSAVGDSLNQPTGYVIGETVAGDRMESFNVSEDALQTCLRLVFGGTPLA
jgi:hypothetical protein